MRGDPRVCLIGVCLNGLTLDAGFAGLGSVDVRRVWKRVSIRWEGTWENELF